MLVRGVIGKRITAIGQQKMFNNNCGRMRNFVNFIELEDGTRLVPFVDEWEADYTVDFRVEKSACGLAEEEANHA